MLAGVCEFCVAFCLSCNNGVDETIGSICLCWWNSRNQSGFEHLTLTSSLAVVRGKQKRDAWSVATSHYLHHIQVMKVVKCDPLCF